MYVFQIRRRRGIHFKIHFFFPWFVSLLLRREKENSQEKRMDTSQAGSPPNANTNVQMAPPVAPPVQVAPKAKKARTPAQLASLARAREAKTQKAQSAAVVKSDDSAMELLERVRKSDPDAHVSERRSSSASGSGSGSGSGGKRKRQDSDTGNYGSTALKVAGVAAVAGLIFLGSKGGFLKTVATPPCTSILVRGTVYTLIMICLVSLLVGLFFGIGFRMNGYCHS
jgi:hypothetical protein